MAGRQAARAGLAPLAHLLQSTSRTIGTPSALLSSLARCTSTSATSQAQPGDAPAGSAVASRGWIGDAAASDCRHLSHQQASTSGHAHPSIRSTPTQSSPCLHSYSPVRSLKTTGLVSGSARMTMPSHSTAVQAALLSGAAVMARGYASQTSLEESMNLKDKLSFVNNLEQLEELLNSHLYQFDYEHVMASLDLMVKSLSSIRNDPRLRVVSGQLAGWFKNRKETLAPTEVVDMLHSFAMLRYNPGGDEQGYKDLCTYAKTDLLPTLLSDGQYVPAINLLYALTELSQNNELEFDKELLSQSENALRLYMSHLDWKTLSKLVSASTHMQNTNFPFLYALYDNIVLRLQGGGAIGRGGKRSSGHFDAPAITNILNALAKVNYPTLDDVLTPVADYVAHRSAALKIHHITTLAKSLAVHSYGEDKNAEDVQMFWETVGSYAIKDRQKLTPQQIQDLAYAFALRKIDNPTLFKVLTGRAKVILHTFKPINLSILLWAMAKRSFRGDPEFLQLAAVYIEQNIRSESQTDGNGEEGTEGRQTQDGALTSYAPTTTVANYLKQLLKDPEGRSDLVVDPETGVERFSIPGKCPLVERYKDESGKTLQRIHYKSGNVVVRELGEAIGYLQYNGQNITDFMYAFAWLGHDDPELFNLLLQRSLEPISGKAPLVQGFTLISVVDCCWAMARANIAHKGILKALDDLCVRSNYFAKMGPDFLTDIVYAMAALEHTVSDKFLELAMTQYNSKWHQRGISDETRRRAIQSLGLLGAIERCPNHPFLHTIHEFVLVEEAQMQREQQAQQQQAQAQQERRAEATIGGEPTFS